ncbi:MAG TPA: sel1 repeat family protein [Dyella sp.]|uniref:tetratricopeptide repeat protein n=1 Tax=Dyella sp. TaxID=1869338 RepID=UPI002F925455
MKPKLAYSFAIALAIASSASGQTADMKDKASQDTLDAMRHAYTAGHPDEQGEYAGMLAYAKGDYVTALAEFKSGARYADKFSQLNIGLMYLNGEGVAKDPVEAFAWIAIAAERKYPQFLATRDRIWSQLDAAQREQGKARVEALYTEYGDAAAKPRMERALRRGLSDMTGTGLGYPTGQSVYTDLPGLHAQCGKASNFVLVLGCGDLYAKARWQPNQYFQTRDQVWTGTVTVGSLQDVPMKNGAGSEPAQSEPARPQD